MRLMNIVSVVGQMMKHMHKHKHHHVTSTIAHIFKSNAVSVVYNNTNNQSTGFSDGSKTQIRTTANFAFHFGTVKPMNLIIRMTTSTSTTQDFLI